MSAHFALVSVPRLVITLDMSSLPCQDFLGGHALLELVHPELVLYTKSSTLSTPLVNGGESFLLCAVVRADTTPHAAEPDAHLPHRDLLLGLMPQIVQC